MTRLTVEPMGTSCRRLTSRPPSETFLTSAGAGPFFVETFTCGATGTRRWRRLSPWARRILFFPAALAQ